MAAGIRTRIATALGIALVAALLGGSAHATSPGVNGRIVFTSTSEGFANAPEVYSVNSDGSDLRRLTWTPQSEQGPVWSPDGSRIAYYGESDKGADADRFRIWVMNADGSDARQVSPPTNSPVDDFNPAWSPDGSQIAFDSTRGGSGFHVWLMNADGTGLHRLTTTFSESPAWSPDGMQIAYSSTAGLGLVNIDGSNAHVLPATAALASKPSWSPDGRQLGFAARIGPFDSSPTALFVVNPDGSNMRRILTDTVSDTSPSWSPDGTAIVFLRGSTASSGPFTVWAIDADGSDLRRIDTSFLQDQKPDWGTSRLVPDTTAPSDPAIDFATPGQGVVYEQGSRVQAFYYCTSYVSFVSSCQGDLPVGGTLDTSAGMHTFTVHATDFTGHTSTESVTYGVVDTTPPDINLQSPAVGGGYDAGSQVTVAYSCSDSGSGVASCVGDQPNGSLLDTSQPGTYTFHVRVTDNAGNGWTLAASYLIRRRPQSISFTSLPDRTYGDAPFSLVASGGGSGNPVTFSATGQCSVAGSTATLTGAGSCTITAHQAGNTSFDPAADLSQSFTIAKAPQTISFAPLPGRLFGDVPFAVSAAGGASSSPVTFGADGACTVSGSTVTITDIGSCTVTAHQDGDANYLPAADVARTFAIDPPPGCNQPGQVHGNEDFAYGSSDVFIQSSGVCVPSLQQAAARITLGGKVLIDAGQSGVTSVTFTRLGDVVIIGSWNGTAFRIDLHDGGKGGSLDTLRVRCGDLDTGTLTAIHGDVLVSSS